MWRVAALGVLCAMLGVGCAGQAPREPTVLEHRLAFHLGPQAADAELAKGPAPIPAWCNGPGILYLRGDDTDPPVDWNLRQDIVYPRSHYNIGRAHPCSR
jgi:hypothetical protein